VESYIVVGLRGSAEGDIATYTVIMMMMMIMIMMMMNSPPW